MPVTLPPVHVMNAQRGVAHGVVPIHEAMLAGLPRALPRSVNALACKLPLGHVDPRNVLPAAAVTGAPPRVQLPSKDPHSPTLPVKVKAVNAVSPDGHAVGIVPIKSLLLRSAVRKLTRFDQGSGSPPVAPLLATLSLVSCVKASQAGGNAPLVLIPDSNSTYDGVDDETYVMRRCF